MANWEFEGGEAKSGLMGLLALTQSQYGLETGADSQYVVIDPDSGVLAWYGDRGDGTTEQLVVIDSGGGPYGDIFGTFGSFSSPYIGVAGFSNSAYGVLGSAYSGIGVYGTSDIGVGVTAISGGASPACVMFNYGTGYGATVSNNLWVEGNCSALTFTDRTPFYEGDALSEISKIKGKGGEIDHNSLPAFVKVKTKVVSIKKDSTGKPVKDRIGKIQFKETTEVDGRDIGAMVSILTVGIQQLLQRVEALEK